MFWTNDPKTSVNTSRKIVMVNARKHPIPIREFTMRHDTTRHDAVSILKQRDFQILTWLARLEDRLEDILGF